LELFNANESESNVEQSTNQNVGVQNTFDTMWTIPSLLEFDELMALVVPTLQAHACEIH
jgi:hypothetical protein